MTVPEQGEKGVYQGEQDGSGASTNEAPPRLGDPPVDMPFTFKERRLAFGHLVSATFHLRKWLSSQEITPKNAAEKAEPTTIVA